MVILGAIRQKNDINATKPSLLFVEFGSFDIGSTPPRIFPRIAASRQAVRGGIL